MKFLIVAGEASGDLHGANLVKAIKKIEPKAQFIGTGGEKMQNEGVKLFYHIDSLSVMGFFEVLKQISFFKEVHNHLKDIIERQKIDGLILIDYPGLNLRLAKIAKSVNLPVYYYISPQIWAWKKNRLKKMEKYITKLFYVLPFEKEIFNKSSLNAYYVGHPLMQTVKPRIDNKNDFLRKLSLKKNRFTIGLFPGSRKQEVGRILPEVLNAFHKLYTDYPFQLILNYPEHIDINYLREFFNEYYPFRYRIVKGYNYDTMFYSDLLLVTSGTATLEAALSETPFIIMYKTGFLTYLIAKQMINLPNIGLANLIAGKTIVPELIQEDLNTEKIIGTIKEITSIKKYREIKKELKEIKEMIGYCETNKIIAENILSDFK